MKTIHLLIWAALSAVQMSHGSPQAGDEMIVESEGKKSVHGFELGTGAARLVQEWRKSKGYDSVMSTGNYDGCYFKLILRKKRLYLSSVSVDAHSEIRGFFHAKIPVGVIYQKKETFADWFTGELQEYFGEPVGYTEVKSMVRSYRFKAGELIAIEVNKVPQRKKVAP